jgi:Trypsin-co-occurring domain 1
MTDLIQFELEDGSSVLIETEGIPARPVTRGGRATEMISKADETFEHALGRIVPTSAAMIQRFRGMATQPDEIEIEFGVKISAEAGAIIAKTSGEANFRIAVRWKRA